jgi:hypothetical protein
MYTREMRRAWRGLSKWKRKKLLERLGFYKGTFTKKVDPEKVCAQNDFYQLSIPVKTFIGNCFDGSRFTLAQQRRNIESMRRLAAEDARDANMREHGIKPMLIR